MSDEWEEYCSDCGGYCGQCGGFGTPARRRVGSKAPATTPLILNSATDDGRAPWSPPATLILIMAVIAAVVLGLAGR